MIFPGTMPDPLLPAQSRREIKLSSPLAPTNYQVLLVSSHILRAALMCGHRRNG
jgi:hypothetical protein